MNLHDLAPHEAHPIKGFYVDAWNIHNDEAQQYGPFPGNPGFTYSFLRCDFGPTETEGWLPPDDHIFEYYDGTPNPDTTDENEPHWIDQEGQWRDDGWRRCYSTQGQFGIARGKFWTDMAITPTSFETEPEWESNTLPEVPA